MYSFPESDRFVVDRVRSILLTVLKQKRENSEKLNPVIESFLLRLDEFPEETGYHTSLEIGHAQIVLNQEEFGIHIYTPDWHEIFRVQYFSCDGGHHCVAGFNILEGSEKVENLNIFLDGIEADVSGVSERILFEDFSDSEPTSEFLFEPDESNQPEIDLNDLGLTVGYVYVLSNKAIPDYVKIGMTTRSPKERAKGLSGTGVPGEWKVFASALVPDCVSVEKIIHNDFRDKRHSANREFFQVSCEEAERLIDIRAAENIARYPGWPNPEKIRNHIEKIKGEEQRRRAKFQLQREHEKEKREQEKLEAKVKAERERMESIDAHTKKVIKSGPIGWGMIIFAGFWLIIDGNEDVKILAVIGTILAGLWFRRNEKNEAIATRTRMKLPPVS